MIVRAFRLAWSKWTLGQKRWFFFWGGGHAWSKFNDTCLYSLYIIYIYIFVGFETSKRNYEWLFHIVPPFFLSYVLACSRILWWLQWSNTLQPSPLGDGMVMYLHNGSEGWLLLTFRLAGVFWAGRERVLILRFVFWNDAMSMGLTIFSDW